MESPGDDGGSSQAAASAGHVRKVKDTWRQFEDLALAQRLQDEEFHQHFDHNRSERRLVQGDLKLSKEEQQQEDQAAVEYYEQKRREREREDERIAMDIQRRMQLEEIGAKRARELQDEMLARRMQEMEVSKKHSNAVGNQATPHVFAGARNPSSHHRQANIPGTSMPQFQHALEHQQSNEYAGRLYAQESRQGQKKAPPPRPPPPRHNSVR